MIKLEEFNSYLKYGKGVRIRRAYLYGNLYLPGWYINIEGDEANLFIGDEEENLYHSADFILKRNHPWRTRCYWVDENDVHFDNLGIKV